MPTDTPPRNTVNACMRRVRTPRASSGFTLIEVAIYTGIVGLVLAAIILTTTTLAGLQRRATATRALEANLGYVLTRIRSVTEDAVGVELPATGTGTQLMVVTADPARSPTTFTVIGGQLTIAEGTGAAVALTSADLNITTFTVTRIPATPGGVRLRITGRPRGFSANDVVVALETTVGIRR